MKVGTDGTLLGAWATAPEGQSRILDIGTGTGLIALMMAQRYPEAQLSAVDIDSDAVAQARENVALSPFAARIAVSLCDIKDFEGEQLFDAIVSNPPFFPEEQSMGAPDRKRLLARQSNTLDVHKLVGSVCRLLKPEGRFSVIIPTFLYGMMVGETVMAGLHLSRVCYVRTTPRKEPKRVLVEFSKLPVSQLDKEEQVLEVSPRVRSTWYSHLTQDFYIR